MPLQILRHFSLGSLCRLQSTGFAPGAQLPPHNTSYLGDYLPCGVRTTPVYPSHNQASCFDVASDNLPDL
jgi:hypothetical protein